ncbi:MAG: toll/interleukin-1 receptor domain-containing protein [Chloroflexota bacterium]
MGDQYNLSDVMISYSRRDKAFVQRLDAALRASGREVWVDWEDIPTGADFMEEIQAGIEAANTFVFIISPDSLGSSVCYKEVEHAVECKKRLIPILHRDINDELKSKFHPAVGAHNWLYFRESDDFDQAFQTLVKTLETDIQQTRTHTRLLVRAQEWEAHQRNPSYLLQGDDTQEALGWLAASVTKEPHSTPLQNEYILASQQNEAARQQLERKLQRQARTRLRLLLGLLLGAIILVIAGFLWFDSVIYNAMIQVAEDNVSKILEVGTAGIDGDTFKQIANGSGPSDPLYQQHMVWLNSIKKFDPSMNVYTYIPGTKPNEILFIGDTSASGTTFRESYIFDPPGVLQSCFSDAATDFGELYGETSGTASTLCKPLLNAQGQIVGALGIDIFLDRYLAVPRQIQSLALTVSGLLIIGTILGVLAYLGLHWRQRRETQLAA